MTESVTRTLTIVQQHHELLAGFARENHTLEGRGVIQVEFSNVPPGQTGVGVRIMKYVTLDELNGLTNPSDEVAGILLNMVETYDPARQAVVLAAIDGENPISLKLKLELPTIVHAASSWTQRPSRPIDLAAE